MTKSKTKPSLCKFTLARRGQVFTSNLFPSAKTSKRIMWWLATSIFILLIFLFLPFTPDLVKWVSRHASLGKTVNMTLGFLLITLALLAPLRAPKQKRVKMFAYFLGFGSFLMFGLMAIKLPIERIHIFEYGALAVLACRAFQVDFPKRNAIASSFCLAALIGILDEVVQYYLPNRFFEMRDVWFNILGGAIGLTFYTCYQQILRKS